MNEENPPSNTDQPGLVTAATSCSPLSFGAIHRSLVICEWCKRFGDKEVELWRITGHKVFKVGEVIVGAHGDKPAKLVEHPFVKYTGECTNCGEVWSQDITPEMAEDARQKKANVSDQEREGKTL